MSTRSSEQPAARLAMDPEARKNQLRQLFDSIAPACDGPATRLFPFCADRLVNHVKPRPGTKVLDVATGSGAVAVAFAQAIGASGRVTAVDFSAAMLDRAEANIRKMALANVDLHEMDAERLDFRANYFHSVVCSYGLCFLPDMLRALRDWVRVLRPGGKLVFTSFESNAFQPMLDDFVARLEAYGVSVGDLPFAARRIASLDHCRQLLREAGLAEVAAEGVAIGYHLSDETEWWEVVTGTAMRGLLDQLPDDRKSAFRSEHLSWVARQKTENGLWLDAQTRFASGVKPA